MSKKFKIIIPVLCVLLAGSIVLALIVTGIIGSKKITAENADTSNQSGYSEAVSFSGTSNYPYMQTEIKNIFYSVEPSGKVTFFEIKNNSFSAYSGKTETINANFTSSNENITIKVYYIVKKDKTIGYGLYKNDSADGNKKINTFVFARLLNMPSAYSGRGKMLLIDTNADDIYSADKTYSDAYSLNMTSGNASRITTERDRGVGKNGAFVDDWFIVTDSLISSVKNYPLFISGRFYSSDTSNTYDVFFNTSYSFERKVSQTFGTYLREVNGGYVFLKKTSDGFMSAKRINGKSDNKKIAAFKGDINKDFIFCGNWVFDKNNYIFTNLINGKSYSAGKISAEKTDRFIVSPESDKFVLYCTSGSSQAIVLFNSKTGSTKILSEKSNSEIYDLSAANNCWIDNDTFMDTSFNSDKSSTYKIIKF